MNDKYAGRPHRRMSADYWKALISEVLEEAKAEGHIITVRTEPRLPLAMGNYDLVVEVRERRVMAEPTVRPVMRTFAEAMRMARDVFDGERQGTDALEYLQAVLDAPIPPLPNTGRPEPVPQRSPSLLGLGDPLKIPEDSRLLGRPRKYMRFEADPMRNETLLPPGTTEVPDQD